MIHVLYTIPNFVSAGSGKALLNIVKRLNPQEFKPLICVSKRGGKLEEEVQAMGIPIIEADFTVKAIPYTKLPGRAWKAAKKFKKFHIDLWHSFHYLDDYTEPLIAKLAGVQKWVFTKKNMNWYRNAWYVRSMLASGIAAQNSEMIDQFFYSPFYRYKSTLIPRGIDTSKFCPGPSSGSLKNKLKLNDDELIAVTVSHLVPIKGHPVVIEALKNCPKVHLVIAGREVDPEYSTRLKTQVEKLGLQNRVSFLGGVEDVADILNQADIYLMPTESRGEGSPVALLEAMGSGKPCIASKVPGINDVIENGINGLQAKPGDVVNWSKSILAMVNNSQMRMEMGRLARETVLKHFRIEQEVEAHERFYESLKLR